MCERGGSRGSLRRAWCVLRELRPTTGRRTSFLIWQKWYKSTCWNRYLLIPGLRTPSFALCDGHKHTLLQEIIAFVWKGVWIGAPLCSASTERKGGSWRTTSHFFKWPPPPFIFPPSSALGHTDVICQWEWAFILEMGCVCACVCVWGGGDLCLAIDFMKSCCGITEICRIVNIAKGEGWALKCCKTTPRKKGTPSKDLIKKKKERRERIMVYGCDCGETFILITKSNIECCVTKKGFGKDTSSIKHPCCLH